jgi:hypothetical protein
MHMWWNLFDDLLSARYIHIQHVMKFIFWRYSNAICFPRKYDGLPEEQHWRRHVFRARMRKPPRRKALRGRNQPYIAPCDMEFCCYAHCVRRSNTKQTSRWNLLRFIFKQFYPDTKLCILQLINSLFWITTPPRHWEWLPDVSTNVSILTNEILWLLACTPRH